MNFTQRFFLCTKINQTQHKNEIQFKISIYHILYLYDLDRSKQRYDFWCINRQRNQQSTFTFRKCFSKRDYNKCEH